MTVCEESTELLNRISGNGLGVTYRFLRKPYLSSDKMVAVELTFRNTSSTTISEITIGATKLQSGMKMQANVAVPQLLSGGNITTIVGIDFNDTLQPANFDIWLEFT